MESKLRVELSLYMEVAQILRKQKVNHLILVYPCLFYKIFY